MAESQSYSINRNLPKVMGNSILPPVIIGPDCIGRFESAYLNDNGLWNIVLDNKKVIRNVDPEQNIQEEGTDVFSRMAGHQRFFLNISQDSRVVPWTNMVKQGLPMMRAQRDMFKNRAEAYEEMALEKPYSPFQDLRQEKQADSMGRVGFKLAGKHLNMKGKGTFDKKTYSPEQEEFNFGDDSSSE